MYMMFYILNYTVNSLTNAKHEKKIINKHNKCSGKHKRLKWLLLITDANNLSGQGKTLLHLGIAKCSLHDVTE